jgi:hypothetical protein
MEEGVSGAALDGIARRILKVEHATEKQSTLKQGLDDGVKLK